MKKLFFCFLFLFSCAAWSWPNKDITLIVPYPPGGVNDQLARFIQPDLEAVLRVSVNVKNMPGSANSVAIGYVLGKENDNHTFIVTMDDFISGPLYQGSRSYNNFKATNLVGMVPYVLFGSKSATLDKFKKQIADKQVVNVANNGANGGAHLWISNLKSPLVVNSVFYKGSSPVLTDVAAGHSEYGVSSLAASYQFIQSGKLVPIMQSGKNRSATYPMVPTATELGFRGNDSQTWFAIFARRDTTDIALDTFAQTVHKIISTNSRVQEFRNTGMNIVNIFGKDADRFFGQEVVKFETQHNSN